MNGLLIAELRELYGILQEGPAENGEIVSGNPDLPARFERVGKWLGSLSDPELALQAGGLAEEMTQTYRLLGESGDGEYLSREAMQGAGSSLAVEAEENLREMA